MITSSSDGSTVQANKHVPTPTLNVLLVEDSAILAERLAELLVSCPGVVLAAVVDNEAQAIAEIRRGGIDAVVLDLHLRQGTGFGVLRAARLLEHPPAIIVLTNYDLVEYRDAAAALGARDFLDKAHEMNRLPEAISQLLQPGSN